MRQIFCVTYAFVRWPYSERNSHVQLTAESGDDAIATVERALSESLAQSHRIISCYPVETADELV